MTLPQARVILENYLTQIETCEPSLHRPEGLAEAIRMTVATLPRPVSVKTAAGRLAEIREAVKAKTGLDPFAGRTRDSRVAVWRHCAFRMMLDAGYSSEETGRAAGYNHTTVLWGAWRVRNASYRSDPLAARAWEDMTDIMGF